MVFTVADAIMALPQFVNMIQGLVKVITSNAPADLQAEVDALNLNRMRNSEDIIADADRASGR